MIKEVLALHNVHEVPSYPYGRLRCKAFFSIEFKKGFGFRSVFQTINPKNDRLNAPKYGTYYTFLANYVEAETDHIKTLGADFNGIESIVKGINTINKYNEFLFLTPDMYKYIYERILLSFRVDMIYKAEEAQTQEVLNFANPFIKLLIQGIETGENKFPEFNFNHECWKNLEKQFPKSEEEKQQETAAREDKATAKAQKKEAQKVDLDTLMPQIEKTLHEVLSSRFFYSVSKHKNYFGESFYIKICIACNSKNGVPTEKPQSISLSLSEYLELKPQMFGGVGGNSIDVHPAESNNRKYSISVPFRTPDKDLQKVLKCISTFAGRYIDTLKQHKDTLRYKEYVNYEEILI